MVGWIWESIYCTINNKKWENRGFLYGPICPIYGVASVIGIGLTEIADSYQFQDYRWWQVFIFFFCLATLLEYFTAWALEKLFNAYWWDYSDMPLNIKGRICLPASLLFGAGGLLIVYVLAPLSQRLIGSLPPILLELVSLLLMAVMAADATLTISALTDFQKKVFTIEGKIDARMNEFYHSTSGFYHQALSRVKGFRIRHVKIPRLHLSFDLSKIQEFVQKVPKIPALSHLHNNIHQRIRFPGEHRHAELASAEETVSEALPCSAEIPAEAVPVECVAEREEIRN